MNPRIRALLCGLGAFASVFAVGSTLEHWRHPPSPWGFTVFRHDVTFWSWLANLSNPHDGSFWSAHSANIRKSCILIAVSVAAGWAGYRAVWIFQRPKDGPENDYRDGPREMIRDGRFGEQNSN